LVVWWTQFTGAAWAAGTADTNIEIAIDTTAAAMQRRIKRAMVSGSLSFLELVVMANEPSFRSEHWRSGPAAW
jgi:hypothetical protein